MSEMPLLHFEHDPDGVSQTSIKCDVILEWRGEYFRCQIYTGTYTSSGLAGAPFGLAILYHEPVGDHRSKQSYASYEEARDMKPAEEQP